MFEFSTKLLKCCLSVRWRVRCWKDRHCHGFQSGGIVVQHRNIGPFPHMCLAIYSRHWLMASICRDYVRTLQTWTAREKPVLECSLVPHSKAVQCVAGASWWFANSGQQTSVKFLEMCWTWVSKMALECPLLLSRWLTHHLWICNILSMILFFFQHKFLLIL